MDTEQVLLALIEQPQGVVPQILEMLKVDAGALAERLDAILRASPKASPSGAWPGRIYITPRVLQVLTLADEETCRTKAEKISTEQIFLAILSEEGTPTTRMTEGAGINRERASEAIR